MILNLGQILKKNKYAHKLRILSGFMVSIGGVEPPQVSSHEPESCASTSFAIST